MRRRKRRNKKRLQRRKQKNRGSRRIPHEVKEAVLSRDGNKCRKCGTSNNLTLHHIKYRRYGGQSTVENLITVLSAEEPAPRRMA